MDGLHAMLQDWGLPSSEGADNGNGNDDLGSPADEVELSWISIGTAVLLILVNIALSVRLSLGLESRLTIAAVRCVVQLSVLGVILEPIFNFGAGKDGREKGESTWWLVVPYTMLMTGVAAVEASSRPASAYRWMLTHSLIAMAGSVMTVMTYLLVVVVRMKPWWNAQYFIPITGMLLGNATSGVSLGLSTLMNSITTQTRQLEMMLALGATRWEATKAFVHQAIITAMTPTLNTMCVVGIVSIPGMMTGQILGGQSPMQAARYQIVIFFAILASSTIGCVSSVYMAASQLVDANHRYRPDRINERTKSINGLIEWVLHKLSKFRGTLRMYWIRLSGRLLCCNPRSRANRYNTEAGWRGRWAGMDWQGWSPHRSAGGADGAGAAGDQSLDDIRRALSGDLHPEEEEDRETSLLSDYHSADSHPTHTVSFNTNSFNTNSFNTNSSDLSARSGVSGSEASAPGTGSSEERPPHLTAVTEEQQERRPSGAEEELRGRGS